MRIKCQKCLRRFSGKVGTLLCDNCKIETYNNGRQKIKEESRSEEKITKNKMDEIKTPEEETSGTEEELPEDSSIDTEKAEE